MYEFKGKWLCDERFLRCEPLNIFHKEYSDFKEPFHPEELKNVHMLVRGSFRVNPSEWDSIRLVFSADDWCRIRVNGQIAAIGPCEGYFFAYYRCETDIKKYLKNGVNDIEIEVIYMGVVNRVTNSGDLRMGCVADIYGIRGGEPELLYCTDDKPSAGWKYTILRIYTSKTTFGYSTQFTEDYDSRLEPSENDFRPCVSRKTDYIFEDKPAEMLQIYETFPEYSENLPEGGIFYDFGHELTGMLSVRAKGPSGSRIRILCGEETDESPEKVRYGMRCRCNYEDFWTLSDDSGCLDQFDYKAFRYASLIPEGGAEILGFSVIERHNPFDDSACVLESSDKILESVFNICKNGVKYGSQDVFVDCPSREKGQYAGDMTITSASSLWLTGSGTLTRKAIENQMQSAYVCPGLMAVAPGSQMQEIADYSLQFPILALRYYKFSGDIDFLKKCYEASLGIYSHFSAYERGDGLLDTVSDKWNLVDWPEEFTDGYDFPLGATKESGAHPGVHNVINAFYIGFLFQLEEMADILGIKHDMRAEKRAETFNRVFFDAKTGLYVDAECSRHSALHSNVLPLFYGFAPENNVGHIADFLYGKKLCCGVYFAYFLLKALSRAGRYSEAWSLVTSTDKNSWHNMVREGGTTCFEAWGKDRKKNTSLCHPWASAPVSVILEDILGLNLDGTAGESHIPGNVRIKVRTPFHGELVYEVRGGSICG